jgi:diguanylate cyclase (GGDEF)-like protein
MLALVMIISFMFNTCFTNTYAAVEKPVYNVLFISSYHAGFDTLPDQIKGMKTVFDEAAITLDIDYMDTKRVDMKENYENYFRFLQFRLNQTIKYDVILVGDDNGLQFLMDHRESLVPDVPIVFFCINDLERAKLANELPNVTGIVEDISLKANLDLAVKFFPNAKKIYGIIDDSPTGKGDASSFLKAAENYSDYQFELLNASEHSLETFKNELSAISATDIVFYMSYFEDGTGNIYSIDEATTIISETVKAPVFRMSIGGVGSGLLGGNMVSYEEQGRLAALMALSIIKGENPNEINMIQESPNKDVFDYKIMQRYGLKIKDLPEGSIVLNKPIDYFQLYKKILMPAIGILMALMFFIAILIVDIMKLKAKDKLLYENNIELAALNEEMIASEEELREQYDKLSASQKSLYESEDRYRVLAFTDTLTGLSNRTSLMLFLEGLVGDESKKWSLLYIDIDNFKYINDSSGHEIGDAILHEIGYRLRQFENQYAFLSRLGGDEFVMVVNRNGNLLENDNALNFNLLVKAIMTCIEQVIEVRGLFFYLTCSVGISNYPDDGRDKAMLLRKADMAMYQAKFAGRSRFLYFNDQMEIAFTQKLVIQNQIRFALSSNQFLLFYQPQYDLRTNKMVGTEALIRWRDGSGNFMPPSVFIPIAEEHGLIQMIGRWVYEEVAKHAKIWFEKTGQRLNISVNVSALELSDEQFADTFIEIINRYGLDPEQVAVEITESLLIVAKDKAISHLECLKEKGIKVHLDDFGAGYSSLNYMITLPLDVVKIDRQFIIDMIIDKRYEDMVRFIIDISHCYGLQVIAEGVETEAQLEKLKSMNCDMIQGYHYAKPMPFDALIDFSQMS